MNNDARADALAFLKSHKAGVLATVGADGAPHASAIYYVTDDDFNLYFLTLFSSRKYEAIRANPAVAFTVGTSDVPQTLQIEGVAAELSHEEEKRAHISDLVKVLTSNSQYYAPITKLDPSEVVMIWVQPKWVRWADFSSVESGTEKVLVEIPLK